MDIKFVYALAGVVVLLPLVVILGIVTYNAVVANQNLKRLISKQDLTIEALTKDLHMSRATSEARRTRLITAERKLQSCNCSILQPSQSSSSSSDTSSARDMIRKRL